MPSAPGREPRYETLDVWRGLACLMVVLHHSGFALRWSDAEGSTARWLAVGFVRLMDQGVPLFFVISGYCIAASLDGHRRRGSSSWEFLKRRVRRIYPPYWAALLVFVATTWLLDRAGLKRLHAGAYSLELDSPGTLGLAQWLGNLTLTETWRPRLWGGIGASIYTRIGWSLCFEEQFYFLGFLALLIAPRRLYEFLGTLTVAIVGFRVFAYDSGWLMRYRGTFLELWHEFAVGLLVYWSLVAAPSRQAKLAVIGALIALFSVGVIWSYRSTTVAAGFGLILIAIRDLDGAASRLTHLNPLRGCGKRCYSIYLIHLPVCTIGNEILCQFGLTNFWTRTLVVIPVVSTLAVASGWGFFRLVESRFLRG